VNAFLAEESSYMSLHYPWMP